MKKLTAGIFATLLAVVSAGDANAKIASQAYVDQEVGAVEATVTEVQQNVTNVTEQVTQVTEQVTEITNPDTGLAAVVGDAEGGLVRIVQDFGDFLYAFVFIQQQVLGLFDNQDMHPLVGRKPCHLFQYGSQVLGRYIQGRGIERDSTLFFHILA